MKKLIATCFISINDLLDLKLDIPVNTTLVNLRGYERGKYFRHITEGGMNYHTMTAPGFLETPFDSTELGVIIECPFDTNLIKTKLGTREKPKFVKK